MLSEKLFLSSIILFVLLCFSLISSVWASSIMWSQTYGGIESEMGYSVVATSDGGYAIAGGAMFPSSSYDFWLVKTDRYGKVQWTQSYSGGKYDERAQSLVKSSDGGYAIAGFTASFGAGSYDFWLVKTDANGNMQWNRTYGGPDSEQAYSLVETSDGGYAIAGYTGSFGAGSTDSWLVKIGANGNLQWNRTYGGTGDEYFYSLVVTSDGGYVLAGGTESSGAGGEDFWLVRTDKFGNMQWNRTYGGTGNERARSLVVSSDGGYAIAGGAESFGAGKADFWLVKTDDSGTMIWNRTYGGADYESAQSLVKSSDGGYVLAGFIIARDAEVYPFDTDDFWVIKTDGSGKLEWNQTYGGLGDQRAYSLVESSDGGYAIAGYSLHVPNMNFLLIKTDEFGIIPEFPSLIILPLLLTATLADIIYRKKLTKKEMVNKSRKIRP
jgi:hypothetical protein